MRLRRLLCFWASKIHQLDGIVKGGMWKTNTPRNASIGYWGFYHAASQIASRAPSARMISDIARIDADEGVEGLRRNRDCEFFTNKERNFGIPS